MSNINFIHKILILLLPLFSTWNVVWAAGGVHDAKPGCETIKVFNNRLFPDDFGGSYISKAEEYCNGKNNIYILGLGTHAKCELRTSKVTLKTLGDIEGHIDFEYEYVFKPMLVNIKGYVLDYCISKSSTVEKFEQSKMPNETQAKVASYLAKHPLRYKITKQKSGTNFKHPWTYFSSGIGTQVIYVVVVNKRFKSVENKEMPNDDYAFSDEGEIIYKNIIIATLMKGSEIIVVKEVPSIGEVFADADGDGFPEVVYEYDGSENTHRELTDLKPDTTNRAYSVSTPNSNVLLPAK